MPTRSLRRALGALSVILVALGLLAAAGPAQAVTWTQVDRHCVSSSSGSLCAATYQSSEGWKGTITASPASGHWIKLTSVGFSHGDYGGAYCMAGSADAPCPARVTSAHTWSWTSAGEQVIIGAEATTDTTKLSVSAGNTGWIRRGVKCVTMVQGKACVSAWYEMRRSSFYYRSRGSVIPAAGRTIAPEDARIAIHYTVYPSTTVKTITRTTDFDGVARSSSWSAAGSELQQIAGTACDHLGALFHYRAGGVVKYVNLSTSSC